MRQVNQWWKAAMVERGADTRRLITIYLQDRVYDFVTGQTPLFGAPNSAISVSPHSASIDPWTRATTVGERLITLKRDRVVRDMVSRYSLEGIRIEIRIGAASLGRNRFEVEWIGQIRDAHSVEDSNSVLLRAADLGSFLRDVEMSGSWAAMHPLDIVRDIYSRAQVPRDLYEISSFDYRNLDQSISHWSITRAGANEATPVQMVDTAIAPFNAQTAVQELNTLMNASITFDYLGRQVWQRADPFASPIRHWPREMHGGFRMQSTTKYRCDQINVQYAKGWAPGQPMTYRAMAPADVIARHRFQGGADRPKVKTISTPWVNGVAHLSYDLDDVQQTIELLDADANGFAGLRFPGVGITQNLYDQVTPGGFYSPSPGRRWAFVQIEDEIIHAGPVSAVNGQTTLQQIQTNILGNTTFNWAVELSNCSRGALGTTPAPHGDFNRAYDVTIPIMMTFDRARFFEECPIGELRVPICELDVGLCDKVSFDDPRVLFRGCDGATQDHVWEVIGMAVDESGPQPALIYTLCFAYSLVTSVQHQTIAAPMTPPITFPERLLRLAADQTVTDLVVEDMTVSTVTGRQVEVAAGWVSGTGHRNVRPTEQAIDLLATRDNYIRFSIFDGRYVVQDVAVGDPAPTLARGHVPLAMARTDGSSVTAITDQRPTRPLDGANLRDDSVTAARVAFPLDEEVSIMESSPAGLAKLGLQAARLETTNATPAVVLAIAIPSKTGGQLEVRVGAARTSNNNTGAWRLTARVVNDGTGATIPAQTTEYQSRDDVGWSVALTSTGGGVLVEVTGAASQTIDWTASANLTLADMN